MSAKLKRPPKKPRRSVVPQPNNWDDIKVGAVVLASAVPRHFEWYEAVVLAIKEEAFQLRYAEWPDEPTFTRSREQLALLHPSNVPPPPLEPTKAAGVQAATTDQAA